MTDYTKLTEREINEAVLEARGWGNVHKKGSLVEDDAEETCALVGYRECPIRINICNNPILWAPLLEELQRMGQVKIEGCTIQFEDTINEKPKLDIFIGRTKSLGKRVCTLWLMVKEVGNNEKL